jgi:flagellar basal body rod protein FlgC
MKVSTTTVAQSGISAASASLAVSANNVANGLSKDFVPSRADASDVEGGGVRVSISKEARASVAGESGTDLVDETVRQSIAVAAYRANLKSLQVADEVNGALMGLGARPQE